MYTRFTTLTNELKSLRRIIPEEDKVEKILTRVLPITWESKISAIQESKNIATLPLDELIENLTAYELRRQSMKMDVPKKERSLALRITEGSDLEDDEMAMITKDFKKYPRRGKGPSRSENYSKSKAPEKQTMMAATSVKRLITTSRTILYEKLNGRRKELNEGTGRKNKFNPRKDEQALMAIGESDEETEVSVIYLKDKINLLSKERLYELLIELLDESEDVNNEKEQLSKECVILKAKCKNLELRVNETVSENTVLKNQVHTLDSTVLKLRYENLKLKLGTGKKIVDHTQLTLEENVGKIKDELYKRDEKVQVKGSSQIWYMDSGCSKHMTRSKNQFLSLEDLKGGNVSFGNGKKCEIIGIGKGEAGKILFQKQESGKNHQDDGTGLYGSVWTNENIEQRKNQKKLGNQLASIRSDHGTEFENAKFAEFCDEHGINCNFSAPRTPQQNGVVQIKNRTLEEMARSMLLSSKLPHSFWAEAVNIAC
ncbi:uncharacterized protein [Nicotiana tomentosiformis]|uniref:uncharacterized protein n=1 Tax=Nicotiana tomentosiformis TaxID=4098 RepID=UPI00388C9D0C